MLTKNPEEEILIDFEIIGSNMKRSEMVEEMINFYISIPNKASVYHKMDMLLSRMERIGILPPPHFGNLPKIEGNNVNASWEEEDSTPWCTVCDFELSNGKTICDSCYEEH